MTDLDPQEREALERERDNYLEIAVERLARAKRAEDRMKAVEAENLRLRAEPHEFKARAERAEAALAPREGRAAELFHERQGLIRERDLARSERDELLAREEPPPETWVCPHGITFAGSPDLIMGAELAHEMSCEVAAPKAALCGNCAHRRGKHDGPAPGGPGPCAVENCKCARYVVRDTEQEHER
jgi:hypothetical protein